MNFFDLPRHIQEHVKFCNTCQQANALCPVGAKLHAEWKIIAARIDKLPKLGPKDESPRKP